MNKALRVLLIALIIFVSSQLINNAFAQTPCQPIYGGGQTCTITPTPPATTKRGFPVLSPVPVTSTPSTGPEALVLFSLIPAGILGWLLRKYSTKRNFKQPPSI